MRFWKNAVVAAGIGLFLAGPVLAYYDEYDDYEDAHPLRIVSYPVHAAGYALEWLVTRPIHALVSQPELQPIFGRRTSPWDFDAELPSAPEPTVSAPPAVSPPAVRPEDVEAMRRAAEDARIAAEEAKRAAEAAARSAEKADRAFERSFQK